MISHRSAPNARSGFTFKDIVVALSILDTVLASSAMKKNKKKKAAKNSKKKTSLLGGAAKSLKKLGKGTAAGVGKLSTTQKVVAGAALGALGIRYLLKQRGKSSAPTLASPAVDDTTLADDVEAAEHNLTALDDEGEA
jgi:hypothetical protein